MTKPPRHISPVRRLGELALVCVYSGALQSDWQSLIGSPGANTRHTHHGLTVATEAVQRLGCFQPCRADDACEGLMRRSAPNDMGSCTS